MSELDLKPFCSTDETRPEFHTPFTQGGFTYATDGRLIIRVSSRAGIAFRASCPEAEILFARNPFDNEDWRDMVKFPPPKFDVCTTCCTPDGIVCALDFCEDCDNQRKHAIYERVSIRGDDFNNHYLALAATLPGIQISLKNRPLLSPLRIQFEGGIGLLASMTLERTPQPRRINL